MWICVPALKLCQRCVVLPQYHLIRLEDGMKTYGLTEADVASIPTLRGRPFNTMFLTQQPTVLVTSHMALTLYVAIR
jgi:hypothetical protein